MHVTRFATLLICVPLLACGQSSTNDLSREAVFKAQELIGLDFSQAKIDLMLSGLREQLGNFEVLRRFPLSNSVPPAFGFNPVPTGMKIKVRRKKFKMSSIGAVKLPTNLDELAHYSIGE